MATGSASESDIPGYYYDESTKRYFKLPPSHFSQLPTFSNITAQPQAEPGPPSEEPSHDLSLYNLIQKRREAFCSTSSERALFSKHLAGSLQCTNQVLLKPEVDEERYIREAERVMVSRDGKAIIVANSVDDCIHRKIGLSFGLVKRSHKSNFRIHWDYYHHGIIEHCDVCDYAVEGTGSNIYYGGDLGMTTVVVGEEEISEIFEIGYHSRASFSNDFAQDASAVCISPYKADVYDVVCAIGTESGGVHVMKSSGPSLVIGESDAQIESVISLVVKRNFHSSICSLAFANEGKWVYAGSRNGTIHAWDLQGSERRPCLRLTEPKEGRKSSCVTAIQPLQDTNYIVSSAYNSKLSLWDVRMCKKVLQYKGHVNDYRPCKSPLVDHKEDFVFAAGSDNCVRVWSLGNGQLLRTISPQDHPDVCTPADSSITAPPVVCYTDVLGGCYDPTLIVCNHKELAFFRL